MNIKELTHERMKIMQAFMDGKTIEFRQRNSIGCSSGKNTDQAWNITREPLWDWTNYDYRVQPSQPEIQYRPLTYQEMKMYTRYSLYFSHDSECCLILYFNLYGAFVLNRHRMVFYTYSELLEKFRWDATPHHRIGVEIKE